MCLIIPYGLLRSFAEHRSKLNNAIAFGVAPSKFANFRIFVAFRVTTTCNMSFLRRVSCISKAPRRMFSADTSPPLMWKLAHGMFDSETDMTEKLPGIPDPTPIEAPKPSDPQITTLSNGLRVVSQDMGGPVTSVALFVGAGSRHETSDTSGVSFLLERLAYKGSAQRSKFRMVRDIERTGALFNASASRETIAYAAESLRGKVPDVIPIIAESAYAPFENNLQLGDPEWDNAVAEVKLQKDVAKSDIENLTKDPNTQLVEAIHGVAFHGNSLGFPLIPKEHKLQQLDPAVITDFLATNFTPDRMVLSAANYDHSSLVSLVEESLGSSSGEGAGSVAEARYTGGGLTIESTGPGHVAIGFNGVSWQDEDLVPICVLHTLLGGGGSFSSGGPGKGMYTRLYTQILNKHAWITSAMAFNHCYSDTGLFGIQASCEHPSMVNDLIEVVGSQVGQMANALGRGELSRAKAMTKSSLIMNLESRGIVCEDLGRQVLSSGKYTGPEELVKMIDAVTENDLRRVATRVLDSTPSVVTYGEEIATYDYTAIASSIKSQAKIEA